LLALALAGGGCSFSYQLDNMLAKKDEGKTDQTGTLRLAVPKASAETPAEADLAFARAAVTEVLAKGGKHTSLPWENPKTGARGTVTPLASTYQQDGVTCRDFLASYVKNGSESWLQGEACRAERGKWEVRNLRPRAAPSPERAIPLDPHCGHDPLGENLLRLGVPMCNALLVGVAQELLERGPVLLDAIRERVAAEEIAHLAGVSRQPGEGIT
jgi:surface antigen